jgi:hypothetical protein
LLFINITPSFKYILMVRFSYYNHTGLVCLGSKRDSHKRIDGH